jgi:hypothetical protein
MLGKKALHLSPYVTRNVRSNIMSEKDRPRHLTAGL